jgi:hypothetical protein
LTDAGPIVGTAGHYAQFISLVRARIEALGITFETVDRLCSFPDRYCATLLSGGKAIGIHNFFVLAAALALTPMFAHNAADLARLEQHSDWIRLERTGAFYRRNHKREIGKAKIKLCRDLWITSGRKGGMASARKLTPAQRSKRARKAVAKRKWRPVRRA